MYIKCGETDILIDAGSESSSSTAIIEYVDRFVEDNTLEYVIATHADSDHISAFFDTTKTEGVFSHYKVETIIDFNLTNKAGQNTVEKYFQARDNEIAQGAVHYSALECYNNQNGAQRIYQISEDVEMEILYNYYYENTSSDENNYSVCLMFNQGENHFLFTGDLEEDGEKRMVEYYKQTGGLPECVFYKAGHHGSKTSTTVELMQMIKPKYCVVSCCAGVNQYHAKPENVFPTQAFIDHIAPYTDKIYIPTQVDFYEEAGETKTTFKLMNGEIVLTSKPTGLEVKCSNNNTVLKDTEWFKANRTWPIISEKVA